MTSEVNWTKQAKNELITWWIQGPDRKAITKAQTKIDDLLATDPKSHGVEVSEQLFSIQVPPLKAPFEIHEAERTVEVTGLGLMKQ
ncbi:MAG: hypothetical protein L0Y72_15705 [Gemmataceae bacterium]|nr:hypothetical protein [Gemmataceae bacterium]MCI0740492.1 hypothetical protein [Gemmataceae bacterium]